MAISLKNHEDRILILESLKEASSQTLLEDITKMSFDNWLYKDRYIKIRLNTSHTHCLVFGNISLSGCICVDLDVIRKLPIGVETALFRYNSDNYDPANYIVKNNSTEATLRIYSNSNSGVAIQTGDPYKVILVDWK